MSNEQLALRIKAGEDVADNMLKLWQQNQGMIEELAGKYCHKAYCSEPGSCSTCGCPGGSSGNSGRGQRDS